MCGRYNLRTTGREVGEFFHTQTFPEFDPLYNIAPTDAALMITHDGSIPDEEIQNRETHQLQDDAPNQWAWARWGLLPVWLKELKGWAPRMNARSETVATNRVFRSAFASRRCLVPSTGFYEWKEVEPRRKQPFHIQPADQPFLALAGIWELWKKQDRHILSCSVLTCEPNRKMSEIHDRMPVILDEANWSTWLDPSVDGRELSDLLVPCPDSWLKVDLIATTINNARNKSAEALQPLTH